MPQRETDDNELKKVSDQLQNVIGLTPKKNILVVQGDWNTKVSKNACGNWQDICGPFCNDDTNERGLRLLEFATFDDFVLVNTFVITKHPEDRPRIAQIGDTTARLITF